MYTNSITKTTQPHIYAMADYAYDALKSGVHRSQCCVISGESGAGKTESAKHFIKHLIYLCLGNTRLELQILQVNPLLEAFGNATTLMNDNSSRFGKYIELSFLQNKVVGARISEYLLEKSRVVFQNDGEHNFHIFYYLIAGLCGLNGADQHKTKARKYFLVANDFERDPNNSSNNVNCKYNDSDEIRFNYLKHFSLGNLSQDYRQRLMEKFDELVNALNYIAFMEQVLKLILLF